MPLVCWITCLCRLILVCIRGNDTRTSTSILHKKPYEVYGFTEKECLYWRVSQERFDAILDDELTIIHDIRESSNNYGEFLFVTTSRKKKSRTSMYDFLWIWVS